MQVTSEIETSLKREFGICTNAVAFYKKKTVEFEQRYHLTTNAFLKKFEAGELDDNADFFDWFAFAGLLERWRKTRAALHSAVR